jgi:hypothetical protein
MGNLRHASTDPGVEAVVSAQIPSVRFQETLEGANDGDDGRQEGAGEEQGAAQTTARRRKATRRCVNATAPSKRVEPGSKF